MKKSLTSILSLLLSFMILVSAFPITANAATLGSIVGTFLVENTDDPVVNLEVTLQDSSRNVLATTTTDAAGRFTFTDYPVGEYYIVPTGAAYYGFDEEYLEENGYYVIVVSSGENTFFKGGSTRYLRETLGSGKLIKIESETNKPIPNTTFEFYTENDTLLGTYITDANGEITISNLSFGKYYFLETVPADGYFANTEKAYIEVNSSSEATVTVTNNPICSITLIKTDRDTNEPLYGAFFELRNALDEILGEYSTDENGTLKIDNLAVGDYKLIEFIPPVGYYIDDINSYEVSLSAESPNKTIYATNADLPEVYISKVSSATDSIISGAVIDIMQGDTVIWDNVSLPDEMMFELAPGDYSIVEVKAPEGYVLDSTPVNFTVVDDPNVTNSVILKNDPIIVEINKYGENENGNVEFNDKKYSYLPNCEFVMTNTEDSSISYTWTTGNSTERFIAVPVGTYEIKELSAPELYDCVTESIILEVTETNVPIVHDIYNDIKIFSVTIDKVNPFGKYVFADFEISKDGKVVDVFNAGSYKIDLQPGEYTVAELTAPKGYAKASAFTFTLDTNGVITTTADFVTIEGSVITIINNPITLHISKIDSETDTLLSGAHLKLSKNDGTYEKTFVTDGTVIVITEELEPGEYTLEETTAPNGYSKAEPLTLTIRDTSEIQTVVLRNNRILGTITVNKTGETLSYVGLVEKVKGFFTNVFEVITGQSPLSGVSFTLYADENITHPDGVTADIYNKGDIVATGITNSYGLLTFDNLPLGQYRLVETDAPDGYYTHESSKIITVDSESIVNINIENHYKTLTVNLEKTDATDSNKVLEGAVYGLYANEDILSANGTVIIEKGSLVDVCETDANGLASMKSNAPIGEYIVKEIKAPSGYVLSDEEYIISFDKSDIHVAEYIHSISVTNAPIIATFEKLDSVSLDYVIGAKLQLINESGEIYYEWTNNANSVELKAIPTGKYTLREVETPAGYKTAEDMQIVIEETAEVQKFIMYDDRVTGSATVNKFVKGTSTPIPGVTFELYNETLNMFVGTFTTNSSGQIYIPNLAIATFSNGVASGYMTYRLTEISTQPGYVRETNPYRFTLNMVDPDLVIETDVTLNVENDYTKVHILKTDKGTGEALMGAELALYASTEFDATTQELLPNAEPYATWLSDNDAFVLERVPVGNYLLVETSAPEGYIKAENLMFTVANTGLVHDITLENDYIKVEISKLDSSGETYLPGAEFALYERSEFNDDLTLRDDAVPYETWTTGTTPYSLFRVPVGDYLLVETKAPEGYVKAEPQLITIVNTTEIQSVSVNNDVTKVQISKKDIATGEELPGATLAIYDYQAYIDSTSTSSNDATPLYSWVSTSTPRYIEKLPVGKYVLVETSAPEGYVKSEVVEFEVIETGDIQSVTMYNDVTKLEVVKKDAETKENLADATLSIYTVDSNDNPALLVREWVTDGNGYYVEKLPVGKYVLIETNAPNGYITAEPVYFEIKETSEKQTVVLENNKTIVSILKTDNNSNPLAGAEYSLYDEGQFDAELNLVENAIPVETFTTTEEPTIFVGLPVGNYLLVETVAPTGYVRNNPVLIAVEDINEEQLFTLVNEPTHVIINKAYGEDIEAVANAVLGLYKSSDYVDGEFVGEPILTWTTTLEGYEITALAPGEYVIRELVAPAGYTTAKPFIITVEETAETQIFTLIELKTEIIFVKLDAETKQQIAGADFVLYYDANENGIVDDGEPDMDKWTSTKNTYTIIGLPVGKYILVETKAPEGYEVAENLVVNVRDTSDTQIFEILNEKIPEPIVAPDVPNTGDYTVFVVSGIFLTASLFLLLTVLVKKNKIKFK